MSNYTSQATGAEPADDEFEYATDTPPEDPVNAIGWTADEMVDKAKELLETIARLRQNAAGKRAKILKWRRQAEATAEPRLRTINPLKNPSNVTAPLTQIYHQSLTAWIIAYFATEPFLGVKALKDDDQARKDATLVSKVLNVLAESPSDLNLAEIKRDIASETSLIGRAFVKVVWSRDSWAYKQDDPLTGVPVTQEMVFHEGPQIVLVEPEKVDFSNQWKKIYDLPLISHAFTLPKHQLEADAARGIYDQAEVDKICSHPQTDLPDYQKTLLKDQGINVAYTDDFYDLVEVWFYCDHDGDGLSEEYVWTIHVDSGCVLRAEFNTIGARMFESFRWIAHTYDLDGRGVGQTLESLQDEATSIRNIRNDAMKAVSMVMFEMPSSVAKANSEEIYSGKNWINDSGQPIARIPLGEVPQSSIEAEDRNFQTAAQATAFSEVQRGFSDQTLKSRDTWRGQQLRMSQSQGITSTIADGMRETWNRVTLLVILQLVAHKDTFIERERKIGRFTDEEIADIDRIFAIEPKDVPTKWAFVASTIDADRTQAAQMQGLQLVSGWYQQWIMQATPSAQFLFGPQGQMMQQQSPELYNFMLKNLVGSAKLIEKAFKLAGIDDPGSYLPKLDRWEFLIQMIEQMEEQQMKQIEAASGQRRFQIGQTEPMGAQGAQPVPAATDGLGGGGGGGGGPVPNQPIGPQSP